MSLCENAVHVGVHGAPLPVQYRHSHRQSPRLVALLLPAPFLVVIGGGSMCSPGTPPVEVKEG